MCCPAAPIVEGHQPLGKPVEIGDVEPDTGIQFAGMLRQLGHDVAGLVPALGPLAEAGIVASYMIGSKSSKIFPSTARIAVPIVLAPL